LQPLLALNQWQLSCALTVQEQKIEGEEDQLIGSASSIGRLELTEDRYAVGIESAEFAVEVSRLRLQGAKRLDCAAVSAGPIEAGPSQQFDLPAVQPRGMR